ncbi:MAG TPA: DinB family protein [Terriglobia bacterium]|nr:DinB family protein [Terriglobia bacterium]
MVDSPQSMIDQFRDWYDYEKDSHRKVIAALRAVPAESQAKEGFQRAVDLLSHIVGARTMWLYRLGVISEAPQKPFPQGLSLDIVEKQLEEIENRWTEYLSSLEDSDLARTFEYGSMEGPRFRNRVDEVLTQLFGHSSYHRGQIAYLVRSLGAQPAATDFILWARQPVQQRQAGA